MASSRLLGYDRWRRPISGHRMGWLFFDCATVAVVFLVSTAGECWSRYSLMSFLCGELWRSVCPSPQWSRVHAWWQRTCTTWYGVLCTAQPYRSQRRSLWQVAIALSLKFTKSSGSTFLGSGRSPEEWACVHRQRPLHSHPTMCTVVAAGPVGRDCDDPYCPPAGGSSGAAGGLVRHWTCLACRWFCVILLLVVESRVPACRVNHTL